jgi:nucleoside-diphosphate-sugar epimerase
MMSELYIVTGGNGHLGNTIIRKLRAQGKKYVRLSYKMIQQYFLKA